MVTTEAMVRLGSTAARARELLEWEDVRCLLCAGDRRSVLITAPDPNSEGNGPTFAVVRCHECGLCYTNPRPRPEAMSRFYPPQYRPHHEARPGRHGRLKRWETVAWHGQGRLLDFGCGGGTFLQHMHAQGWRVTGVDTSPAAVARVRSELGLAALVGTLPHANLGEASFDVITMWHSLEHVHQPLDVLRAAHRLLAPEGKLVIGVPNIDSLPFRWFGVDWFGLDLPRHLTHFTPATLRRMLERAGYHVERISLKRHSDWLRSSARLSCRRNAPWWQRCCRLKPLSSLVSWYAYLTRATDCIHTTARALT